MGYRTPISQNTQRRERSANLDVLPEVSHASVIVLVTQPFRAVHGDLARELHAAQGLRREVLDLVHILLADLLALLAVVDVVARDSRGDREKDEPVARGQTRAFVEP